MGLTDKSLEELESCESKISQELNKKRDEKTLAEGGFRCLGCLRVFPKDKDSQKCSGQSLCQGCGWKRWYEVKRSEYALLESLPTQTVPPLPIEIFHLRFCRNSHKQIEMDSISSSVNGLAAVVDSFILKIGDRYAGIGVKIPDDSCDEDVRVLLELHGTKPPVKHGSYWVWEEK